MKQFLLFTALLFTFNSFSQSTSTASEYMSYFSASYLKIQQDMWDYTKSVSHGKSARKVDKRRVELISTINSALASAKRAKPFEDNASYRDSVISYFNMVDIVLREDYSKIVNMEEVSEQSYDLMEAYMLAKEIAGDKLKEAGDMINEQERKFAETNNITLIESESKLGAKIEISNKVYAHYNAVYLVFFKSYKQELYLLDAISNKDISAIEQNRNALIETVEEGLKKLDTITKFENDPIMIQATKDLLKFYQKEAESNVDLAIDYFEKADNFNSVKEAFDKKKQKDRTQDDVDAYNNGVNDMNKAVENYNNSNNAANKERGDLIDNWNKSAEKFTTKHVPRGK